MTDEEKHMAATVAALPLSGRQVDVDAARFKLVTLATTSTGDSARMMAGDTIEGNFYLTGSL